MLRKLLIFATTTQRWLLRTALIGALAGCAQVREVELPEGPAVLPGIRLVTTEVPLWKIERGIDWKTLRTCSSAKRIAYAADRGNKWVVVVDGVAGPEYDQITIGKWWYESVMLGFSSDCKRFAHTARRGKEWLLVVDGVEGKSYDAILEKDFWRDYRGYVQFSPDGEHVVHTARRNDKWFLVIDGVEGRPYRPGEGRYDPGDSKLYAEPCCGDPAQRVRSPDNKRVAQVRYYDLFWSIKTSVVVDSVEYRAYDEYAFGGGTMNLPAFSPDSKHVAYLARREDEYFVVVDGVEGPPYPVISYRSAPLAWNQANFSVTFDSPTRCHTLAVRDGQLLRVEIEIVPE